MKRPKETPFDKPSHDMMDLIELGYSLKEIRKTVKPKWKLSDREYILELEEAMELPLLEWFNFWDAKR